jgi:hypothetical protein
VFNKQSYLITELLNDKPAWRSSIWMSMNVIFTPATANGYSQIARSPFCLRRSSWKDFCKEKVGSKVIHWFRDNCINACHDKHLTPTSVFINQNECNWIIFNIIFGCSVFPFPFYVLYCREVIITENVLYPQIRIDIAIICNQLYVSYDTHDSLRNLHYDT